MTLKVILVMWLSYAAYDTSSGAASNYADPKGDIHAVEFRTIKDCEKALAAISAKAKHIKGICIEGTGAI